MLSKIKYYLSVARKELFLGLKDFALTSLVELIIVGLLACVATLYMLLK